MSDEVLTEIDGPIARIIFNRPAARNAANAAMLAAMRAFLQQIEQNKDIRCITISGAGDHFMAGGDVAGFSQAVARLPDAEARRVEFEGRVQSAGSLFVQLARMPQPIVAKIRGAVAGAALGFVAGADFAICGASAIFILAHVNIGVSPDGASSYYLPRIVGVRKAKELAILGQKINAQEALSLGLVNRVVPDSDLEANVAELVGKIIAAPAESVRRAKHLMDQSLRNSLESQLQLEAECFAACAATEDFVEGVTAFAEKRAAKFNRTR
jgi:2-(1,2-epoxy-1,2-dihydrophenyl)acetyl-CoA isomerase